MWFKTYDYVIILMYVVIWKQKKIMKVNDIIKHACATKKKMAKPIYNLKIYIGECTLPSII